MCADTVLTYYTQSSHFISSKRCSRVPTDADSITSAVDVEDHLSITEKKSFIAMPGNSKTNGTAQSR